MSELLDELEEIGEMIKPRKVRLVTVSPKSRQWAREAGERGRLRAQGFVVPYGDRDDSQRR